MVCLVTGGAGFIGSHLVERLIEQRKRVLVVDNLSSGSKDNLPQHKLVKFVEMDFRRIDRYFLMENDIDCVIHLAAIVSIEYCEQHRDECMDVNRDGAIKLISHCEELKIPVYFASSAAVYGNKQVCVEWRNSNEPVKNSYGIAKKDVDDFLRKFGFGMALRFSNVYGPRQRGDSPYCGVIAKFIHGAMTDKKVTIYGSGENTRDFVYVKDVAESIVRLIEINAHRTINVVNISSDDPVSVIYVRDSLKICLGDFETEFLPARQEVAHSRLSNELIKLITKMKFRNLQNGLFDMLKE